MPDDRRLLRDLHRLWLVLLAGIVGIGVIVLAVADASPDELPPILPAALVAALGVAAVVGVVAVDRFLVASRPADDAAALADFRVRFILQVALVEAPLLLSVVLAFALGPPWVVTVGLALALLAMLRVRPTLARIRRFDASWRANGVDVSLERALRAHDHS